MKSPQRGLEMLREGQDPVPWGEVTRSVSTLLGYERLEELKKAAQEALVSAVATGVQPEGPWRTSRMMWERMQRGPMYSVSDPAPA